jgi:hypothetical protein
VLSNLIISVTEYGESEVVVDMEALILDCQGAFLNVVVLSGILHNLHTAIGQTRIILFASE